MRAGPFDKVLEHLIAGLKPPDGVRLTDGELLARFVKCRDSEALSVLVQRHAGMVWGVCCRHLPNRHDAEDAFQATFFVLVRKASAVPEEMIANWLYGVARQTSVRMRATAAKQARREMQVANLPEPPVLERGNADLVEVVETELNRLPDHYRAVVVLCDLEGLTRRDAAEQLGIPEGSVASRLARARELLTKRLDRRSIPFSLTLLALLSAKSVSSAPTAVVLSLLASKQWDLLAAGQAAGVVSANIATLTEGVVKTMFIAKVKSLLMVALILGMALGVTGLGLRLSSSPDALAQAPKPDVEKPKPEVRPAPKENLTDKDLLQGEWEAIELERHGKKESAEFTKLFKMIINGDEIILIMDKGKTDKNVFQLNAETTPKQIDLTPKDGKIVAGIYLLEKDLLTICLGGDPKDRPQEFQTRVGSRARIYKWRRKPTANQEEAKILAALQGTWQLINEEIFRIESGLPGGLPGRRISLPGGPIAFQNESYQDMRIVIKGNKSVFEFKNNIINKDIAWNIKEKPMQIDMSGNGTVFRGIFKLEDGKLWICASSVKRPTEFKVDQYAAIHIYEKSPGISQSYKQLVKIRDVTLDEVDDKTKRISVSLKDKNAQANAEGKTRTKLIHLPVSAETRVVAPKIFPGVDKNTLFRWNYLKGLQGERVTLHLRVNDEGETLVELISME